jgi:hypothetical protein
MGPEIQSSMECTSLDPEIARFELERRYIRCTDILKLAHIQELPHKYQIIGSLIDQYILIIPCMLSSTRLASGALYRTGINEFKTTLPYRQEQTKHHNAIQHRITASSI